MCLGPGQIVLDLLQPLGQARCLGRLGIELRRQLGQLCLGPGQIVLDLLQPLGQARCLGRLGIELRRQLGQLCLGPGQIVLDLLQPLGQARCLGRLGIELRRQLGQLCLGPGQPIPDRLQSLGQTCEIGGLPIGPLPQPLLSLLAFRRPLRQQRHDLALELLQGLLDLGEPDQLGLRAGQPPLQILQPPGEVEDLRCPSLGPLLQLRQLGLVPAALLIQPGQQLRRFR